MSGQRAGGIDFHELISERMRLGWRLAVAQDVAMIYRRGHCVDRQFLPNVEIAHDFLSTHPELSANVDVIDRDLRDQSSVDGELMPGPDRRGRAISDEIQRAILSRKGMFRNRDVRKMTGASSSLISKNLRELLQMGRITQTEGWNYQVLAGRSFFR